VEPEENGDGGKADRLTELRINYAWDWWKFHAKQRTDMFNYFLLITGILANAYVSLLKDNKVIFNRLETFLCGLGALTSLGFLLLDIRNRRQIDRATTMLQSIESNELLHADPLANTGGPLLYKHMFVFRGIEILIIAGWIALNWSVR